MKVPEDHEDLHIKELNRNLNMMKQVTLHLRLLHVASPSRFSFHFWLRPDDSLGRRTPRPDARRGRSDAPPRLGTWLLGQVVGTGLGLQQRLDEIGISIHAGIAQGRPSCGVRASRGAHGETTGSAKRRSTTPWTRRNGKQTCNRNEPLNEPAAVGSGNSPVLLHLGSSAAGKYVAVPLYVTLETAP